MPELRRREATLRAELDALDTELHDAETYLKLTEALEAFRARRRTPRGHDGDSIATTAPWPKAGVRPQGAAPASRLQTATPEDPPPHLIPGNEPAQQVARRVCRRRRSTRRWRGLGQEPRSPRAPGWATDPRSCYRSCWIDFARGRFT